MVNTYRSLFGILDLSTPVLAALWLHLAQPRRNGQCQEVSPGDMKRQIRQAAGSIPAAQVFTNHCDGAICRDENGGGGNRKSRPVVASMLLSKNLQTPRVPCQEIVRKLVAQSGWTCHSLTQDSSP